MANSFFWPNLGLVCATKDRVTRLHRCWTIRKQFRFTDWIGPRRMRRFLHFSQTVLSLGLVVGLTQICGAYSVLTHEQVVDVLWKDDIQPLLIKRFPAATTEDLKKAHAFAYGGSLIQDMGYYPF